ncbi:hypothetical protein ACFQ1S_39240 [Kibdelosporangium lantanae]|uniref:Uncharacterized protein n=1 Tax=Kibdelosporangium lantanae TaxID=1497396 RepID=A0ABW3MPA4_9PSEU
MAAVHADVVVAYSLRTNAPAITAVQQRNLPYVVVDQPVVEGVPTVRVDDFQWYDSPRADDVEELWYDLQPGCGGDEDRDLFVGDGRIYPIGTAWDRGETHLGIDLENPADRRVFDFHGEDLLDNELDGRPVRGSLYPVFSSYARLLAHVVEVRPLPGE